MSPSVLSPPCPLIMNTFLDTDSMLGTVFGAISSYPTFHSHSRRLFPSKENGNNKEWRAALESVKFCRTDCKCSKRSKKGAIRVVREPRGTREPCGMLGKANTIPSAFRLQESYFYFSQCSHKVLFLSSTLQWENRLRNVRWSSKGTELKSGRARYYCEVS